MHERAFYRVIYPLAVRPKARIVSPIFLETTVSDFSEAGVRLDMVKGAEALYPGLTVRGEITFEDGQKELFEGQILRLTEYDFVIQTPDLGISLPRVMSEQMQLIRRFGQLKDHH